MFLAKLVAVVPGAWPLTKLPSSSGVNRPSLLRSFQPNVAETPASGLTLLVIVPGFAKYRPQFAFATVWPSPFTSHATPNRGATARAYFTKPHCFWTWRFDHGVTGNAKPFGSGCP